MTGRDHDVPAASQLFQGPPARPPGGGHAPGALPLASSASTLQLRVAGQVVEVLNLSSPLCRTEMQRTRLIRGLEGGKAFNTRRVKQAPNTLPDRQFSLSLRSPVSETHHLKVGLPVTDLITR